MTGARDPLSLMGHGVALLVIFGSFLEVSGVRTGSGNTLPRGAPFLNDPMGGPRTLGRRPRALGGGGSGEACAVGAKNSRFPPRLSRKVSSGRGLAKARGKCTDRKLGEGGGGQRAARIPRPRQRQGRGRVDGFSRGKTGFAYENRESRTGGEREHGVRGTLPSDAGQRV